MSALRSHVTQALRGSESFAVTCVGVSVVEDEYVFLNIAAGAEYVTRIHQRLCSGVLQPFAGATPYLPHVTLARSTDPTLLERALAVAVAQDFNFTAIVRAVSAYWIDPDLPRRPSFEVALPASE